MRRLEALIPALLLLFFAFAGGAEPAALGAVAAWLGRALLLALALSGARELADPWRLGSVARWSVPAALLVAAAAWRLSPAPRAGEVALLLLPALVLAVPALASAFARDRALASAAWSAAVTLIAAVALFEWAASGGARIAAPLGQRDLVGLVLAIATPMAARGMLLDRPFRELAAAATLLGGGALLATRSTWPLLGFVVAALIGSRALERGRDLLAGLALLALGLAIPGVERLARGVAPETRLARAAISTSWRGIGARPLLGWGPGTMAWNDAVFRTPRPGFDGAGLPRPAETPAPLQLIDETGAAGAIASALALAAFLRARRREGGAAAGGWATAGGLQAALIVSLGGVTSASALWAVMTALAAGAAMAAHAPLAAPERRRTVLGVVAGGVYVATAVTGLLPLALAQRDYELAAGARDLPAQRAAIESAVRRDPSFPLYEAHAAWLPGPSAAERARRAWRAAERGSSVSALWLRAGWLAFEAGDHRAVRRAFERALRLDPFAAAPPFLIFVDSGDGAIACAARALVAEPRLLAAVDWRRQPKARAQALQIALRWPGIEESWKRRLLAAAELSAPVNREGVDWVTRLDGGAASAVSSRIFRRRPWPAELARIRLDRDAAERVRLAPAWSLATTSPAAFPADRCAPSR